MSTINNLATYDPFADTGLQEESATPTKPDYIHIRIQQRNGRKTLTTLQGLPSQVDLKRLLKHFKKVFSTNGIIATDEELGEVIQLQGDQRVKISEFLISEKIADKASIKVHGF
ncbi:eukaryotic translation initiation factor SUI1 [Neoconidiobolus thromboides FSU 785]|nr:eukaryotic translation initiation factor SUI1 [Neoconidiobolus thromboides FSU 785]